MSSQLKRTLRGVVKDHRLPGGHNLARHQPWFSRSYIQAMKQYTWTKFYRQTNVAMSLWFGMAVFTPFFAASMLYTIFWRGSVSNMWQPKFQLTRAGRHASQHAYNANPDNFYNHNAGCWSLDPMCGLAQMPKRPEQVLKDPAKHGFKHLRDAEKAVRQEFKGFR